MLPRRRGLARHTMWWALAESPQVLMPPGGLTPPLRSAVRDVSMFGRLCDTFSGRVVVTDRSVTAPLA